MLGYIAKKVFGTANARSINKYKTIVDKINGLEDSYQSLSDIELKDKTTWLKSKLESGETLNDILPDAFALVREASKRVLGQRHYDVQLVGGQILHEGKITEMKTGEGKTLVATLPVYLNALTGKGVHVITVNDYLAKRDSEWMGKLYIFLGLSVGCILNEFDDDERRSAYNCDITYGTNHEFGFDYLRDNMKFRIESLVQKPFNYAIVDEVDSILIDEARTPLIISGPSDDSSDLYKQINEVIPLLKKEHYKVDEKDRNTTLTEQGQEYIENIIFEQGITKIKNLYDISNATIIHHIDKALSAHKLYKLDVDYLVKDNTVYIIDEFTGRIMEGRRYSDGLHQALEAKEGVSVQNESQTLASITYQNYFRLYPKLAGMTGTALTESEEFEEIYKLKCIEVPTNVPVARIDYEDEIYLTDDERCDAVIRLIKKLNEKQQPILVGTVSIEKSEDLNNRLIKEGIHAKVLNAKYHEQEAYIIAEAGVPSAITIATNMAGRGTDIQLGGNFEMRVKQETAGIEDAKLLKQKITEIEKDIKEKKKTALSAGGLYVIGTERHESRRIDNQLRGRTGRQGDPGASKFFLSMDDNLMRIFGGERMKSMLSRLGLKDGEAITHAWVSKALQKAQTKVEAHNFDIRKNLLKYDDVMNDQRKVIYKQRFSLMSSDDISAYIKEIGQDTIEYIVDKHIPQKASTTEDWNIEGLMMDCMETLGLEFNIKEMIEKNPNITAQTIFETLIKITDENSKTREITYTPDFMRFVEKSIALQSLDQLWKDHLLTLDHLKQGIGLRAYGQKDPLNEYKMEAFMAFDTLIQAIKIKTTQTLLRSDFSEQGIEELNESQSQVPQAEPMGGTENISRNAPCYCGSGKKFKHCHGRL